MAESNPFFQANGEPESREVLDMLEAFSVAVAPPALCLRVAKLKTRTVRGQEMVREDVPLGKVYVVDLNSRATVTSLDTITGRRMLIDAVKTVDSNGDMGFMPVELLEIEMVAEAA